MANVSAKLGQRLSSGLKRFQPIIEGARARDVGESDTVVIVTDLLAEVFGFDKYSEITSEQAIRGTYCDLAVKLDGTMKIILEVKAVGTDFKAMHLKQAVDYAANQGVDWVVLTNGMIWQIYRVIFAKPIDQELVHEFNLLELSPRSEQDLEGLFLLSKEGLQKSALDEHYARQQATNRFLLGALLLSDPILAVLRRELRRISPDVRVECDDIRQILANEVIKRDVTDSEGAIEAAKRIKQAESGRLRAPRSQKCQESDVCPAEEVPDAEVNADAPSDS
jgi:hypothetical protein